MTMTRNLPTTAATQAIAAHLSQHCPAEAIIFLTGDLGAGKTTFVQGFLQGLGFQEPVKSPTYTVVESYQIDDKMILHFDLYRLASPQELEAIGIRDYTLQSAIWLIEWPDRGLYPDGTGFLPPPDLTIHLQIPAEGTRQLQFSAHTQKGKTLFACFEAS